MRYLIPILMLLVSVYSPAQDLKTIRVATDTWETYSNSDGTGLYFDILKLVYEPESIALEYTITPYKRSVLLVTTKQFDAWVASYEDEEPDAIYPKISLGYDEVVALYKKSRFPKWAGESTLENKKLAWVRGYGYEDYLTTTTEWQELNERDHVLPLLALDRVDAFLDHVEDVEVLIEHSKIDMEEYAIGAVFRLDLYMGFANTERGKALAEIWDDRMTKIIASCELKNLWEKWSDAVYPFEQSHCSVR